MRISFALKLAGSVLLMVSLSACGPMPLSLQATRARESLAELLSWAPTNKLNHLSVTHPIATNRLERVRRKLFGLEDVLLSISNKVERIALLHYSANRILDGVVVRTREWEECDYYLSSRIMLDAIANAMWKTTGNGNEILSLWVRQRRVYTAAYERCREEQRSIKEEYRRLYPKHLKLLARVVSVRLSELTEEELAFRDMWRRWYPYISDRNRVLEWLLGYYPRWDVGGLGRKLDGGKLYERFKSLTPEQLKEIEDRYGDKSGK